MIVFDIIDILCISFSAGSSIAYLIKKYRTYKRRRSEDPIVTELKEKSPVTMFSENGKPLKLPLIRDGDKIKGISIVIKNKKLAILVEALINARRKQKLFRLLRLLFFASNTVLTSSLGLYFPVVGSLNYTQLLDLGWIQRIQVAQVDLDL